MEKIRNVFSPGGDKDDKVLYGDAEARPDQSTGDAPGKEQQTPHTTEEGHKKDHSILSRILHPGRAKHDDETAATQPHDPNTSQTNPHHKDHTITQQILNPGGDKYDQERYQDPSVPATVPAESHLATDDPKKEHSILRQIINPGGANYDSQAYGTTAHVVSESEYQAAKSDPTTQKDHSIARQIFNPGQEKYDPVVYGTPAHPTEQPLTDRTTAPSSSAHDSSTGRDAAIAGGAGAVGAGVVAATSHEQSGETPHVAPGGATSTTINPTSVAGASSSQTATDSPLTRDAVITGGVVAGAGTSVASPDSSKITDRPHPLGGHDVGPHINPISAPEAPESTLPPVNTAATAGTIAGIHNSDYDGALGGATAAGGAASQLNQAPADVQNATFTERAIPVGGPTSHHTVDPNSTGTVDVRHVPGEFPQDDGTDIHGLNPAPEAAISSSTRDAPTASPAPAVALGAAAGTAGLAGVGSIDHGASIPKPVETSVTQPGASIPKPVETSATQPGAQEQPIHQSTAIGAVTGASGLDGISSTVQQPIPTATTQPDIQDRPIQTTTNTISSAPAEAQGPPHEYGRDAAVASGVGLVGAGAAVATSSGQDTGPASHTIGPHESNLANIVDPNVKPDLEQQRGHETVGPHTTDLANKADPRVESDPAKIAAQRAAEQHAEDPSHPNKLQKPRPDEEHGEKKPSLIQRILHPGHKSDNKVAEDEQGHSKLHKKSVETPSTE